LGRDPRDYGRAFDEYRLFFDHGVDGLFSDQPDIAFDARLDFLARGGRAA
jgi:glycerophosphoryl diester phosphodiesterase